MRNLCLAVEPKHGEVRFQKINSTIGNFGGGRLMVKSLKECVGIPIKAVQVKQGLMLSLNFNKDLSSGFNDFRRHAIYRKSLLIVANVSVMGL